MSYETNGRHGTRSSYSHDSWTGTGSWLVDTARRNPEALLVLAAGLTLLMRGGGRAVRSYASAGDHGGDYGRSADEEYVADLYREHDAEHRGTARSVRDSVSGAARDAGEYVSEMAEQVYESASAYASSVSSYADDQRRYLARQAYRMRGQAGEMLHEQPLAVAALGLVTGAAVAAFLPPTQMERRTFRPAREKIMDAASRTAERVMDAAGETATQVREDAAERGLSTEGLKDMARDAGETFTSELSRGGEKSGPKSGGSEGSGSGGGGVGTSGAAASGSGASRTGTRQGGTAGGQTGVAGKNGPGAGGAGSSGPGR